MASPKLLIGGVVTVGSVSTAAVVAHQQGFFSSFNKEQETNTPPNNSGSESTIPQPAVEVPGTSTMDGGANTGQQSKPNQKAIEDWLTTNKEITNLTIKVTKDGKPKNFNEQDITESDLDKLPDYLTTNTQLLKKLASGTNPTLTFTRNDDSWKYSLTKDLIDAWVGKTSGNKATLKLFNGGTESALDSLTSEFEAVFKCLRDNESLFSSLSSSKENKTLVFEKDGSWKHIKTAIKEWLSSSEGGSGKLRVQIKKSVSPLYWHDPNYGDEDLIGLLKHLKDKATDYVPKPQSGQEQSSVTPVIKKLKKKSDSTNNEWELITS